MKIKRIKQGEYSVCVHGHIFKLERLFGCRNWTLYNSKDTEVNTTETKSGMLELMSYWKPEYTTKQALEDSCSYA